MIYEYQRGSRLRDENGRVCTLCMTYKPYEEFYLYKGTRPVARCKRCLSDRANAHAKAVRKRQENA